MKGSVPMSTRTKERDAEVLVEDVLQRKVFRGSQVVAGHGGLIFPMHWIHILEVSEVSHMLDGGEMVLTTGAGFYGDEQKFLSYVTQLIDVHAAALCIELGSFVKEVPQSVVELANQHNFPIIIFPHQVRFVDITQDIHTYLVQHRNRVHSDWAARFVEEQRFVEQVLQNNLPHTQLEGSVIDRGTLAYRVMVLTISHPSSATVPTSLHTYDLVQTIRATFARLQIRPLLALRHATILFILEYSLHPQGVDIHQRILTGFNDLSTFLVKRGLDVSQVRAGVGSETKQLSEVFLSHEEALATLLIAQQRSDHLPVQFYELAGIYRWMESFSELPSIQHLIDQDIGSLLLHDKKYHTNLLQTLKVYLDCDRSKQQTADQLFIHRQTLYHRLEQIQTLIHGSLDNPAQRLSIQLSLYAHLFHTGRESETSDGK
ncbi:PucR family transcriptional regulator [Alicyclobacillaceae bacterium I2511]|nr:PucR family transcriptional regulator [Alicyclobacillaceae bacterium I2511]